MTEEEVGPLLENADANGSPSQNDEYDNSFEDYLKRAAHACAAGDAVLGMHLYIAAFEQAAHVDERFAPSEDAVAGLKQAWSLACRLKERALAEYIFEKLEPYLTSDEVAACAEQLQRLALDKLEEFGLSREDLRDMTDMISQDFLGLDGTRIMKVERVMPSAQAKKSDTSDNRVGICLASVGVSPRDDEHAESVDPESVPASEDVADGAALPTKEDAPIVAEATAADGNDDGAPVVAFPVESISYGDIVGYDEAVASMRDFGVGMEGDPSFHELVDTLNVRHGLDRMPAADVLLFRSPAREDANRFMTATLGELGLPGIRMRMEENLQGMPVLCVMAQTDNQPKLNAARNAFEGAGVLVLEDLDLWATPVGDLGEEFGGFMFASLSRGAREAISLVRSAVENPDVFVLASSADIGDVDPFFLDILEPLSLIDIGYPTSSERADIWMEIARDHPSLRGIDRAALVQLSAKMPRYDMYMAAREAIEETYKASLVARRYLPVTSDALFEKLAAYQPLDSEEYRALEDAVVNGFRMELDHLDDLLKGEEG